MKMRYSKPSSDIMKETRDRIKNNAEFFRRQKLTSQSLKRFPQRKVCILCNSPLKGEKFIHRGVAIISCAKCTHLQTKNQPPKNYPQSLKNGLDYQVIYPQLSKALYNDRKKRIYQPKLDWVIESLKELNYSENAIRSLKWTEIGCGSGYFLKALEDFKVKNFIGFDRDEKAIAAANSQLKKKVACHFTGEMEKGLEKFDADIYAAFFALEHHDHSHDFFKALKKLKKGTILVFSVPMFGLGVLLEEIFDQSWSRGFNCEIHTQYFTEKSINQAMKLAGLEIKSKWIFGQDMTDFFTYLNLELEKKFPRELFKITSRRIKNSVDELQSVLDRNYLADQWHVLAVKK